MSSPPKIQKRTRGQTVVYDDYEWIYAPLGIQDSTWTQIVEMRSQGHRIRVIQWPENKPAAQPSYIRERKGNKPR